MLVGEASVGCLEDGTERVGMLRIVESASDRQRDGTGAVELGVLYGDRLDESFTPRTLEVAQQLLDDAGLVSAFWQLQP